MRTQEQAPKQTDNQAPTKKKINVQQVIPFVIFLFAGILIGYLTGVSLAGGSAPTSTASDQPGLVVILVIVFLALYVQILLHEAGHLLFGLLTGYRFLSFRIGSLMIVKQDGRLRLKTLSIAGTGGQCLLLPPAWSETHFPYVLYHLGGALMNGISAVLFFAISLFFSRHSLASLIFVVLSVTGLSIGLMNGIPMRFSMMDNDGGNVRTLRKSPLAVFAFYRMLEIHGQVAIGKRLRDLPEDWFVLPASAEMKNSLITTIEVYAINRLLDEQKIAQTAARIQELLGSDAAVNGIHRNMLRCDLAYCAMMQNDFVTAHDVLDDPLRKFMKSMKAVPSILRTQYAEALLRDHDPAAAGKILARFERIAKKYPYPSDIESENELMRAAQAKSTQA